MTLPTKLTLSCYFLTHHPLGHTKWKPRRYPWLAPWITLQVLPILSHKYHICQVDQLLPFLLIPLHNTSGLNDLATSAWTTCRPSHTLQPERSMQKANLTMSLPCLKPESEFLFCQCPASSIRPTSHEGLSFPPPHLSRRSHVISLLLPYGHESHLPSSCPLLPQDLCTCTWNNVAWKSLLMLHYLTNPW